MKSLPSSSYLLIFLCSLFVLSCQPSNQNDSNDIVKKDTSDCDCETLELIGTDELSEYQLNTKKRINSYFHNKIIPKIIESWNAAQLEGQIWFQYVYEKNDESNWVSQKVQVDSTTISKSEVNRYLEIMEDAVQKTHWPSVPEESNDSTYTLYWSWPVPMPKGSYDEQTAVFLADNGDEEDTIDCDGEGTPPSCLMCKSKKKCKRVCVGYNVCAYVRFKFFRGLFGCVNWGGRCASGGPFGDYIPQ